MVKAYCVKCKAKREIENPQAAMLTIQGDCPDCGTRVSTIKAWGVAFILGGIGLFMAIGFLVLGIVLAALLCTVWGFVAIVGGILMRTEEKRLWRGDLDLRCVDLGSEYAVKQRGFLERWTTLKSGETLRIITDRDPEPLYSYVEDEYKNQFEWEYERGGPRDWVVNMKKR